MRFCVIGDIHGRDNWMDFVKKYSGSHFIFLGDYVDPYDDDIDDHDALVNLNLILSYKKRNPDTVTLLIGNHDVQYIYYPKYANGSLIDNEELLETVKVFRENKKYFQFAYQKGNSFFVHAGISNYWYKHYKDVLMYFGLEKNNSNLAEVINDIGDSRWLVNLLDVSSFRGGGDLFGGPLWADKQELFNSGIPGIEQYVGHNKVPSIFTSGNKDGGSITFCDVLSNRNRCLVINL